jgi:acetyltransferase-like isoleucine patch superfamily enzyme
MKGKRLYHTLKLWSMPGNLSRTKYLKEKGIFYSMGEHCSIMSRKIPLYAKLIKIGNNVHLASNVSLVTHDITHAMLNRSEYVKSVIPPDYRFRETVGCIEIGDDVFVGAGTTILQNVRIGSRVIIGANSLVNKDIPDNCVAAGIPAKVICTLDEYLQKRMAKETYPNDLSPRIAKNGELVIGEELVAWCWKSFQDQRSGKQPSA